MGKHGKETMDNSVNSGRLGLLESAIIQEI